MSKYLTISALSFALLLGIGCDSENKTSSDAGFDSGTDAGVDAYVDPCIGDDGCRACQVDGDSLSFLNRCGDPRVQCQPYEGVIPPPP